MIDLDDRDARLVYADEIGGDRGELIVLADRVASGTATRVQRIRERTLRLAIQQELCGAGLRLFWRNGFIDRVEGSAIDVLGHPELQFVRELDLRESGTFVYTDRLVAQLAKLPLRYLGFGSETFTLEPRHIAALQHAIPSLLGFGVFADFSRVAFEVLVDAGIRDIDIGALDLDRATMIKILDEAPPDLERLVFHGAPSSGDWSELVHRALAFPKLRHFGIGGMPSGELPDLCRFAMESGLVDRLDTFGIALDGHLVELDPARWAKVRFVALPPTPWNGDAWTPHYLHLANVYDRLGRQPDRLEILDTIVTFEPANDLARRNISIALAILERLDESFANIEVAYAYDRFNAGTIELYGMLLQDLGRFDDALAFWLERDAKGDTSPGLRQRISFCLHSLDRAAEALPWLDKILAADPEDVGTLLRRAELLASLKRYDDCAIAHRRVIAHPAASDEDLARSWGRLALMAIERGDLDDALVSQRAGVAKVGDRDRVWLSAMLGDTLAFRGEFEEALAAYRSFLPTPDPILADVARSGMGYALLALGRPAEALVEFAARAGEPDGRGSALALLALERYDDALAAIAVTEAGEPCPYATACNTLVRATIARVRGDHDGARAELRSLLGPITPAAIVAERDPGELRTHRCLAVNDKVCPGRTGVALACIAELAGSPLDANNRIAEIAATLASHTSPRLDPLRAALRRWPASDKLEVLLAVGERYKPIAALAPWTQTNATRRIGS